MMIGITLEEHLLAVELKSKVGGENNGAAADYIAVDVSRLALILKKSLVWRIEFLVCNDEIDITI